MLVGKSILSQYYKYIILLLLFLALWIQQWRIYPLSTGMPAYGDGLEVVWGSERYGEVVRTPGKELFFEPNVFYPEGWHTATFAHGLGLFIVLVPLMQLGNVALAYNMLAFFTALLSFLGLYVLAKQFAANSLTAATAGLLYTFWGPRWYRFGGQINLLLGSALLPWLAWSLERAFTSEKWFYRWLLVAGLIWAFTVSLTFYFLWFGGLVLASWVIGSWLNGRLSFKRAAQALLVPTGLMMSLAAPLFLFFWQAKEADGATTFSFSAVNQWSANLNSLFSPFVSHKWQWMRLLARKIYTGNINETSTVNLGLLMFTLLCVILFYQFKNRQNAWLPLTFLIGGGLLLSLGPTLRWNQRTVQVPLFQPVNEFLWQIGHRVKPEIFVGEETPTDILQAVPLPGFLLTAVIPFWEGARVGARFILVAGMGAFLLVSLGLNKLPYPWLQLLLGGLLVMELLPLPITGVPFPPPAHPAFNWLAQQPNRTDEGVLEFTFQGNGRMIMPIGGPTVYAQQYHKKPVISGAGSVWPAHFRWLLNWFNRQEYPFSQPEFPLILRTYHVGYMLLHMEQAEQMPIMEEAKASDSLSFINCFEAQPNVKLWDYPICVFRVKPPENDAFTVLPQAGWSNLENWGIWSEGTTTSTVDWIATKAQPTSFVVEAFPFCVDGQKQQIQFLVQDKVVASETWADCETWNGRFTIPADLVVVGLNQISLHYEYAVRPSEVTNGQNSDQRLLAVGFTKFFVEE